MQIQTQDSGFCSQTQNSADQDSDFEYTFHLSDDGDEDDSRQEVQEAHVEDEDDINPFEVPINEEMEIEWNEEWMVDDPGPGHEQNVNINQHEENPPVARRPNRWAIDRLPVTFNKKPMSSRVQHHRETWMAGAFYGNEDLNLIREMDFETCSTPCPHCGALYWKAELTRTRQDAGLKCCTYGKFTLPQSATFRQPTEEIVQLFTGTTAEAKAFQTNALKYNKLFATCFIAGEFSNVGSRQHGLWSLKVNGEVKWHNHAYRDPGDASRPPNHGQIFFMDYEHDNEEFVLNQRRAGLRHQDGLNLETMAVFERYLRTHNGFVKAFKTAREVQQQEEEAARREGREMQDVVLVINPKDPATRVTRVGDGYVNRLLRGNQYTITPLQDCTGAVFTGKLPPLSYDAMYFPRERGADERGPGQVFPSTRTLDIQLLPLIHLHGEEAHLDFRPGRETDGTPSLAEYYRYRLAIRNPEEFSIVHHSKKLFSMFLLNGALRVLYDWLTYRATHQKELKAEEYTSLRRFVQRAADEQQRRVGRIVILPPGIYGSPRHMKDLLYDALAVSRKLDHPSYMVTLTCNRRWKEINDECSRSRTDPNFRFDVNNRSFEMRANQMFSDIVREQIFGQVDGEMTVREFQGRGLTHTHGLYIMKPQDQPTTPEDIDKIIWAYYPDPEKYPELYELVKKFMVHGPCDKLSSCHKRDGKCKHGFPFNFRDHTDISGKKPLYKRPNDGRGFYKTLRGLAILMDNRWVVPYNPLLLLRIRAHVNIMYCPSTSACKYFFGYLLKGNFGNVVRISTVQRNEQRPPGEPYDHDEIQEFKEMRHMGAYEAHYYIMGNSFAHIYPAVEVLPVHEEFKQTIIHQEGQEEQALERHVGTKLTAWFELNERPGVHRGKVYTDVVENYLYKNGSWQPSNRHTIGRMAPLAATPLNSELYHLRLLLCNRTDVTSFAALRTVNGVEHPTYKAACASLNLIENEEEMTLLMDELVQEQFPSTLRTTFATLLSNCHPLDPRHLWEHYKQHLAEDYLREMPEDAELAYQLALQDISNLLDEFGQTLEDFSLPHLDNAILTRNRENQHEEQPTLNEEQVQALVETLNAEQRSFFDRAMAAVEGRSNEKYFFLTGPGGAGKTYTYNVLIDVMKSKNLKVVVTAFTGVAANLLKKGKTSHKAFGLPFEDEGLGLSRSTLKLQSTEARELKECSAIIWDEVSMVQGWQLHVLDHFLKNLMENQQPFGGKVVILGGDFRQILPVVPGGSRVDIVDAAVTSTTLWTLFKPVKLKKNERASNDEDYAAWLLAVGDGSIDAPGTTELRLDSSMVVSKIDQLINHCFGKDIEKPDSHDAAILCPTNVSADFVNELCLQRVLKNAQDDQVYFSHTSLIMTKEIQDQRDQNRLHYPPEYLDKLQSAGLPPHKLHLAPGVNVILLRNMRVNGGLCNGTRLKIVKLYSHVLICDVMTGSQKGQRVGIFRITFITNEFSLPGKLRRRQFPVKPCYAITVNKSQGQTLNRAGLYLRTPLWVHGQMYVALSRVKCKDAIKVLVEEGPEQGRINSNRGASLTGNNIYTQNKVYREVLQAVEALDEENVHENVAEVHEEEHIEEMMLSDEETDMHMDF